LLSGTHLNSETETRRCNSQLPRLLSHFLPLQLPAVQNQQSLRESPECKKIA